jgi:hypothetical protein
MILLPGHGGGMRRGVRHFDWFARGGGTYTRKFMRSRYVIRISDLYYIHSQTKKYAKAIVATPSNPNIVQALTAVTVPAASENG